jgi:hypothetical protein
MLMRFNLTSPAKLPIGGHYLMTTRHAAVQATPRTCWWKVRFLAAHACWYISCTHAIFVLAGLRSVLLGEPPTSWLPCGQTLPDMALLDTRGFGSGYGTTYGTVVITDLWFGWIYGSGILALVVQTVPAGVIPSTPCAALLWHGASGMTLCGTGRRLYHYIPTTPATWRGTILPQLYYAASSVPFTTWLIICGAAAPYGRPSPCCGLRAFTLYAFCPINCFAGTFFGTNVVLPGTRTPLPLGVCAGRRQACCCSMRLVWIGSVGWLLPLVAHLRFYRCFLPRFARTPPVPIGWGGGGRSR